MKLDFLPLSGRPWWLQNHCWCCYLTFLELLTPGFLSLVWASVAPSREWETEGCNCLHHQLLQAESGAVPGSSSTPSKYLLADYSSWWRQSAWAQIPALLLPGSLTLGTDFTLQSLGVQSWKTDIRMYLLRPQFCWEKDEITQVKWLAQYPMRRKQEGM